MSIERLLAGLEESAAVEAERLVEDARALAARLIDDANEQRRAQREVALAEREALWRAESATAVADARRRARAEVAAARQRLIERVLTAARARFPNVIRSKAYARALPRVLDEARAYAGDGPAVVRCPPALAPSLAALVAKHAGLTLEVSEEMAPGIVLHTQDGALTVDATLEGRLAASGPTLALEIAALAVPPTDDRLG